MSDQTAKEIVNNEAPILVFDAHQTADSEKIPALLKEVGLISTVVSHHKSEMTHKLDHFRLVVVVLDINKSTDPVSDYLLRNPAIRKTNGKRQRLVIDAGAIDLNIRRQVPRGVGYVQCMADADVIAAIIHDYFHRNIPEHTYKNLTTPEDGPDGLKELLNRLDLATDAISDLRINSTSEVVSELRSVSQKLRMRLSNDGNAVTSKEIKGTVIEALTTIAGLFDHIENSRLASIVVSGATTALMGCSGFSAVASVTIMLASWHGKDAFMSAINKVSPSNKRRKT